MQVAIVGIFISTILIAAALYSAMIFSAEQRLEEIRRRLRSSGEGLGAKKEEAANTLLKTTRLAKSDGVDEVLQNLKFMHTLAKLITQTDLTWTAAQLLGYMVGLGLLGALIGAALKQVFFSLMLAGMLGSIPVIYIISLRGKRSALISQQLPDALDMLVRSLKSGHPLPTALQLASQEMPKPIATEFSRCHEEHALGASIESAIHNMTERVPANVDLKIFAVSVVVQGAAGGNLNEVLEKISNTIRERFKFFGQMKAMTAEGRTSGTVMGAMPWLVITAVYFIQKPYMERFFNSTVGQAMAFAAFCLWCTGITWMNRLMRVEV